MSGGAQNVKKWLHLGGEQPAPPAVEASVPDQPTAGDAPMPPRRNETASEGEKAERMAALHAPPTPPARPNPAGQASDDSDSSKTSSAPAAAPEAQ